jgi:hypothetical protein
VPQKIAFVTAVGMIFPPWYVMFAERRASGAR